MFLKVLSTYECDQKLKVARKEKGGKKDPLLAPLENVWFCYHLNFGLLTSRTLIRESTCSLLSPQV